MFGVRKDKKIPVVPGWNSLVKEYHEQARRAFLDWRRVGSPRTGHSALSRAYEEDARVTVPHSRYIKRFRQSYVGAHLEHECIFALEVSNAMA